MPSGTTAADRASIPDAAARTEELKFDTDTLAALARFDPKALSVSNRVDLALVQSKLESDRWYAVFKAGGGSRPNTTSPTASRDS